MSGTRFSLEVQPQIPERLARLRELADDLLYSWDRQVRGLFYRLDRELWEACGHSPRLLLRRVSQARLEEAAEDRIFMEDYNRALSVYDSYHSEQIRGDIADMLVPGEDLIAYFCAEFGLHESVPLYSGGLGILAGDHCKAASDLSLPFIAVGLLYRQGYFIQAIDGQGNQVARYSPTNFADLPVSPARDAQGREVHIALALPGREVKLKVWQARAGHITLLLLDSDLPENSDEDRRITYQLYGGDVNTRIRQEIVLGIGGVRALRALGLRPTVWHINEGHAAFQLLERCRERITGGPAGSALDFDSALELIAAGTVFTTHTPVAAGHDIFDPQLFNTYFASYAQEMGVPLEVLHALGDTPNNHGGFNMTALALRGSRWHNGVSRIHGEVASRMEGYIWPQTPHAENPIRSVTNGVHVPTFLAREWVNLFDMRFDREWRNELLSEEYWERIDTIPDQSYWSVRQSLKSELLDDVSRRIAIQYRRNGYSEIILQRVQHSLCQSEADILTLGFARRFATYKRATLLFADPARLARLVNDPHRPVRLLFAGKAHPNDVPGQELIRTIHEYARRPEFEGRVIMLENYDLSMARKLVTGVDVWVNTPEYPLEASGTSGQKAGINGVINLSVLDGWWGEGYNGENGWGITPHGPQYDHSFRDREEAQTLLDILEHEVIPRYYARNGHSYSVDWVRMSKASMKSIMPHFNAQRMVMDYVRDYYTPARDQRRRLAADDAAPAIALARWKTRIKANWSGVQIRRLDSAPSQVCHGDTLPLRVAASLGGLSAEDVVVECLVGTVDETDTLAVKARYPFTATGNAADDKPGGKASGQGTEVVFELNMAPTLPGLQHYQIRIYPSHPLLSHPFEMGAMIWL